jgi:putative acyl-CoA dehydrogenase
MCLDVLRAIERESDGFLLLLDELNETAAPHEGLKQMVTALRADLATPPDQREFLARRFAQRLVITLQGALMLRHAPPAIADAFISSRNDAECGRIYGTMSASFLEQEIIDRAFPM